MRLKFDSILHSSFRRLHREQLWNGSWTTLHRNCCAAIAPRISHQTKQWPGRGRAPQAAEMYWNGVEKNMVGEMPRSEGLTHFLLATLVARPLDARLALLVVLAVFMMVAVVVFVDAAGAALEAPHAVASLALGHSVAQAGAGRAGRAHRGGPTTKAR